jgi:hypothetical protein
MEMVNAAQQNFEICFIFHRLYPCDRRPMLALMSLEKWQG